MLGVLCLSLLYWGLRKMHEDFSELRGERRSFFCPNTLWKELKEETKDCMSISQYIRIAIEEKMNKN